MLKLFNRILFFSKIIMLLMDFVLTLYIMLVMNSYHENDLVNIIITCLPLFLTLIIFVVSFFFQKGNDNILFNICSILALITVFIIDFRTIFDQNMVMWIKGNMNFYYFKNQVKTIKILCYTVFIGNIFLIYIERIKNKHT